MTLVSNPVIDAAIAAELVVLAAEVAAAGAPNADTAPLGYGRDLDCVSDVTEAFTETEPESPLGIAQAALRRLTTPRGSLPDDRDYGFDLRAYANRGVSVAELRGLALSVVGEVTKDDRIADAEAELTASLVARTLATRVRITPADPTLQAFSATFRVTSAEVLLEMIGP